MASLQSNEQAPQLHSRRPVRCLLPRWSRASPILKSSDQVVTSRPGSGWYPNSTRAGVGPGSAVSAARGTAICAALFLWPAHSPVIRYAKLHGTKVSAVRSQHYWHDDPPKSLPSRLANKLAPEWPGAMMASGERYNYPAALKGLTRSRRVSWRDVKVGEGEQHVMQSRSIRRSGLPSRATALLNARF